MIRRVILTTLVGAVATVGPAPAQDLGALLDAGRYDDAAASLQASAPEEAGAGAMRIFEHAYLLAFQEGRFADAARGFAAARRVPHLEGPKREMLAFWHGMALFASVRDADLGEEEARAVLEEAQAALEASGDFPRRAALPDVTNVERALELSGRARARN